MAISCCVILWQNNIGELLLFYISHYHPLHFFFICIYHYEKSFPFLVCLDYVFIIMKALFSFLVYLDCLFITLKALFLFWCASICLKNVMRAGELVLWQKFYIHFAPRWDFSVYSDFKPYYRKLILLYKQINIRVLFFYTAQIVLFYYMYYFLYFCL